MRPALSLSSDRMNKASLELTGVVTWSPKDGILPAFSSHPPPSAAASSELWSALVNSKDADLALTECFDRFAVVQFAICAAGNQILPHLNSANGLRLSELQSRPVLGQYAPPLLPMRA